MTTEIVGLKIWVRGIVQGVGFRPFIYGLAEQHHLTGWVRNTSSGVEIEVNGSQAGVLAFLSVIHDNPPPLARIDELRSQPCEPDGYTAFEIQSSQPKPGDFIPVPPDISICPDCQEELFSPVDRRYRYPFVNCTNCGPRFSIIKDIPYDRPLTTMAGFKMCPDCQAEYDDPRNRRFHAQPTACPICGPQLWYEENGKRLGEREEALQLARLALQAGKIIAVKGLGGFHLACDATNPAAVEELRKRKKRSDKPFALMAFGLAALERHCQVNPAEKELLLSRQHPIVILERKPGSPVVVTVAPYQHTIGIMLPYTPLHLLLLEPAPDFPDVLVMTSGNLSEEPIAFEDEDARNRMAELADAYLLHDRPIHMRVDDSVTRVVNQHSYLIRRSRGYAPDPIQLPNAVPSILATGAELKNTFCLTRDDYAFLSHHIGDMENYETLRSFEEGITHFERLFRIQPEVITCDMHPDYLATRYALQLANEKDLPLVQVQHHHAHLAACLADNHWKNDGPVIGLSFDGTGLGTDGAVWGSEFLLGNFAGYRRLYHLSYVPLPGGDLATRKPARMALAHLWQAGIDWEADLPPVKTLCYEERTALRTQLTHRLNSPSTSSMGRLFDAVSALIGVRQAATYEGQAAIELEALADPQESGSYAFDVTDRLVNPAPVLQALISDWRQGISLPVLSARFHNGMVQMIVDVCKIIQQHEGVNTVALSGGVWQNRYLLENTCQVLQKSGFTVLTHQQVPANDGCIALGQAMIAAKTTISTH
jgi:hydrogenase maturation protein HypF